MIWRNYTHLPESVFLFSFSYCKTETDGYRYTAVFLNHYITKNAFQFEWRKQIYQNNYGILCRYFVAHFSQIRSALALVMSRCSVIILS